MPIPLHLLLAALCRWGVGYNAALDSHIDLSIDPADAHIVVIAVARARNDALGRIPGGFDDTVVRLRVIPDVEPDPEPEPAAAAGQPAIGGTQLALRGTWETGYHDWDRTEVAHSPVTLTVDLHQR